MPTRHEGSFGDEDAALARARELAEGLWRDGRLQGTAASSAAVAGQIEMLLTRFPGSTLLAERLASAWNAVSRHADSESGWRAPIAKLAGLQQRFPDSPRIARTFTEALSLTTADLQLLAEREAVADRIAAVQAGFPDRQGIAEDLARALRGVGLRARAPELHAVLVARVQDLQQRFPGSEELAGSFGHVLSYASAGQDAQAVMALAERIEELCARFPASRTLAIALVRTLACSTQSHDDLAACVQVAQRIERVRERCRESMEVAAESARAMVHESFARELVAEREQIVGRIETLLAAMPTAAPIAGHLAMAICSVSIRLTTVNATLQAAARIETLLVRFPTAGRVAGALARTLANATFHTKDPAELYFIVARLRELRRRFVAHGGVAEELAVALHNVTTAESSAERAIACADEIEQLLDQFPGPDLAQQLAAALRNASADATDFECRASLAARVQALHERFDDDEGIAVDLAATLLHASLATADARLHACFAEQIGALSARFPCCRRIAVARRGLALAAAGHVLVEACVDAAACAAITACIDQGLGEWSGPAVRDVLERCPGLRELLAQSPLAELAGDSIGGHPFPIAAILLDKQSRSNRQSRSNWVVAAHQDLAMPVQERIDADGFTGWSRKGGVPYVLPPDQVLAGLVALRLHLDDCMSDNGALAVLPGSHARGRWAAAELAALRAEQFTVVPARLGDVLLLRPLLVHRSAPAAVASRRRVLHVVYAREQPLPVRWRR